MISNTRKKIYYPLSLSLTAILFQFSCFEAFARLDTPKAPLIPGILGGFDGAYIGLNGGFLYEWVRLSYNHNTDHDTESSVTSTTKYGPLGGTFVGYLYEIGASRVLIGAEANTLVSSTRFKSNFGPNTTDIYGLAKTFRKVSAGATFIVGKLFNAKTFIYLKGGVETINYEIQLEYNLDATTPVDLQGLETSVKPKLYGPIFGIGVDYLINPIAVGFEYNITGFFSKFKTYDIPQTVAESIAIKRYEHKFMLRASFRFG